MIRQNFVMGVTLLGILTGCGGTPAREEPTAGEVGTRAVGQAQPPVPPQAGAQGQSNIPGPTFPQKFNVQGPETQAFGFAVTQPGPIIVDVQGQGAPVTVTLQSPGGQPITQQATGNLRMNYNATPQDVQKSLFWTVQIRLAQPLPPQAGGQASGTINVQYPPPNQAVVRQAVQSRAAQQRQPSAQEQQQAAAQAASQMEQAFQQRKAQFEQQQMQRRTALQTQIQPQLDQMRGRMGTQVKPRGIEGSDAAPEGPATSSGTSSEGDIGTRALRGETLSGTTVQPLTPLPTPAITSISVPQGQPGDPVLINGSAFSTGGEVHFLVAAGKDLPAPVQIWTDTQIFVTVPDTSGVLGFNGTIHIKRATDNGKSNLVPFRFNPLLELRQITTPSDFILQQFNGIYTILYGGLGKTCVVRQNGNWFWGPQGNDQFFVNTRLKNGWTVVQPPIVFMPYADYTAGGAYLAESRVGTDSPYVNARFWVNPGFSNILYYAISVVIQGPKGVPDGVVMP